MKKLSEYDELRAGVAKQAGPPLKGPWLPDIIDQANVPEGVQKFVFTIQSLLTKGLIEDQKFGMGWLIDKEIDYVTLQFRSWLYGEAVDSYTVNFPTNWFQHLKQRVLPSALEKRWPVEYKRHTIEIRALYPELRKKLHFPDEENLIHVIHEEEE